MFESQYILMNGHITRVLRILYLAPVVLLLTLGTATAEPLKVSGAIAAAGQMFDWTSSVRFSSNGSSCGEANPLFRNPDGSFNAKPALVAKGITIGIAWGLLYAAHKHPNNHMLRIVSKTVAYSNGAVGAFNGVRNVADCGW